MEQVADLAKSFDILHFHTDYLHFPLAKSLGVPYVTTMHGRLDLPELKPVFDRFSESPVVSISDSQRHPLPQANWQGTVYHGLPPNLYSYSPDAGNYFLFVGRVSHEKRLDRAIEIANRCDMRLYIGAKIDRIDESYFETRIKPLLHSPNIEFLGEIGEREKRELLENATALLFPIDWPEPFGLVMIEALCCGTPVIAYNCGSVPEILEDGVTGFIVSNQEEAVRAARRIKSIDRQACREAFETRFTVERMAQAYVEVYEHIIQDHAARACA
jgi:glycosyltransferase involved in cell wall biosynthesis